MTGQNLDYVERVRDSESDRGLYRLYVRAIWIALVGNTLLAAAKSSAALLSGSTAVLATAVDSVTDLVYTLFMAWGLWRSQQPPDESHPQGHARIEPLVSIVIALMMGLAGWEVIKRAAAQLGADAGPASFAAWPAVVLAASGLVKLVMYALVRRLAQMAHSPGIAATARDNLSDFISSGTALLGVLLAIWLHPLADPVAALLVSIWIFRNAVAILLENLGYLVGQAPGEELLARVHAAALDVEGVVDVHRIVADYVGPRVRVELHVDVPGEISLSAAHDISTRVAETVEALDEVDQAFVHLEPAHLRDSSFDGHRW
ncbi:MAG TPA: cation diffusion facilitator family transporter [Anaerolineae bacterium]|nr:cation diffusion facilitator family transporter [Anaerolineae bacterium]